MNAIFYFDTKYSINQHATSAPVFAVRAFRRGFYPIFTKASAAELNHAIPESVLDSALIGSVCGWNVPGANIAREFCEQKERGEV